MIHIFIGTKAQYVKMAPIIHALEARGVSYNLIDSGQHAALARTYRRYLKIREPDAYLSSSDKDIQTVGAALGWSLRFLGRILFFPGALYRDLFRSTGGVCLIHGDTPTTFLSLLAAKRLKIKVLHLESGLRSFHWWHPFPEEFIRVWTMKRADYLVAPNQWALNNIEQMKIKGKALLIEGNTNIDVLRFIRQQAPGTLPAGLKEGGAYVVFSIHRAETILQKKRLRKIVRLVEKISAAYPVLFCLHPPTKRQLEKGHLLNRLQALPRVHLEDLLPYPSFIETIRQAHFIVTDGGSVQEESYYLNVPCLLMREHTERTEGIGTTVCLSKFEDTAIDHFLANIEQYRSSDYTDTGESPSDKIVQHILEEIHVS